MNLWENPAVAPCHKIQESHASFTLEYKLNQSNTSKIIQGCLIWHPHGAELLSRNDAMSRDELTPSPSAIPCTSDSNIESDNILKQSEVTPFSVFLIGGATFSVAALATGVAHYAGTAKRLSEEGIPLAARQQAFPLAFKALFASTIGCVFLGGIGMLGYMTAGGDYKSSVDVSLSDAIAVARHQRVRCFLGFM